MVLHQISLVKTKEKDYNTIMMTKIDKYVADVLEMTRGQLTPAAIAVELGISEGLVYTVLRSQNVKPYNPTSKPVDEEAVCEDYLNGTPVTRILSQYSISYNRLYKILSDNKVSLRTNAQADDSQALRVRQVVQMYRNGDPLWRITMETGIQQPRIHAILHQQDIPLRRARFKAKVREEVQDEEEQGTSPGPS